MHTDWIILPVLRGRWINIQRVPVDFPNTRNGLKKYELYKARVWLSSFHKDLIGGIHQESMLLYRWTLLCREREREKQIYFHPSGAVRTVNTTTHQSFSCPPNSEAEEIEAQLSEVSTTATEKNRERKAMQKRPWFHKKLNINCKASCYGL